MALEYAKNCYNCGCRAVSSRIMASAAFIHQEKNRIFANQQTQIYNNNMETMKKYLVIIAMALALCLSGCATKGSAISDLRNLRNDIVDYGYRYDVDDWRNAATRYQKIDEKLKKYANDYTYDESREIGRLKGEWLCQRCEPKRGRQSGQSARFHRRHCRWAWRCLQERQISFFLF